MDRTLGPLEPLIKSPSRLVGVAAEPQSPRSDALGGNADFCAKPERKLPVLLRPVQSNRAIEV